MEITANAAANAGSVLSAGIGRGKSDAAEGKNRKRFDPTRYFTGLYQ